LYLKFWLWNGGRDLIYWRKRVPLVVPYDSFYLSSLKKVFVFRTNTIEFFGEESAVVGRFVAGGLTCRTIPDGWEGENKSKGK
jgi:hypothetical protein